MQFHSNKLPASSEKLRGGYYTPPLLAQFLVDWSVRSGNERILEPSCGDGVFVEAILNRLNTLQSTQQPFASTARLTAVEVLKEEIEKAKERASCEAFSGFEVDWVCDDFFSYSKRESDEFDLVIGNPPFIRFQHVNSDYRDLAFDLLRGYGYHPNKLANAWCSFVQISIEKLAIGGRLAMVLPAELLQVKYAAELRERLPYIFEKMSIVGFKRLVFSEIQQEVVLLLCDGKQANLEKAGQVFSYDVTDADELKDITAHYCENGTPKRQREGKWTTYFADDAQLDFYEGCLRLDGVERLETYGDVDVGIVTGRNSFFVATDEVVDRYKLRKFAIPCVGRTSHLKCLSYSKEDWSSNKDRIYLIDFNGTSKLPKGASEYVRLGEEQGVQNGYKCRIRKRWYDVPSIYRPDCFLYRQIHRFPLLVSNDARVVATDTIHRFRLHEGVTADLHSLSLRCFNSLFFAASEVLGRSYGGGVLEIEPNEADHLPLIGNVADKDAHAARDEVSKLLKLGESEKAIEAADTFLLHDVLGLSKRDIKKLNQFWRTLMTRRIDRK